MVLRLALLVVVAAPVGELPGTRQVVWHIAACELHAIMQLVTVEVCASRIVPAASARPAAAAIAAIAPNVPKSIVDRRILTASAIATRRGIIAPAARPGNCLLPALALPMGGRGRSAAYAVRM